MDASQASYSSDKSTAAVGDLNLLARFSEQMVQLFMSNDHSDVMFIVENEKLPAHRNILATRSEYFRAMLFGGLSESTQNEIRLKVPLEPFKALLKYIYSGNMAVAQMKQEAILEVLGLANQYGLTDLEIAIADHLRQILSLDNVCTFLNAAKLFGLEDFTKACHAFLDENAETILKHESFKTLSQDAICSVLMRDSFLAAELEIFEAAQDWCKCHSEGGNADAVMANVRFSLLTVEQLVKVVRPTGIVNSDRLMDAVSERTLSTVLPYRRVSYPEENVACSKYNAKTIEGILPSALLNGSSTEFDKEKHHTQHLIGGDTKGIVVDLGKPFAINHIKIRLWTRDNRSYYLLLLGGVLGPN